MDDEQIERALGVVFDQAVVAHGYTDYLRDYDVIVAVTSDPATERPTQHHRLRFRCCVEARVTSTVLPETWRVSTDDRLIDAQSAPDWARDHGGYAWGVRWHELYPGGELIPVSDRARSWRDATGLPFREVHITTNAHAIELVFVDLEVTVFDGPVRAAP